MSGVPTVIYDVYHDRNSGTPTGGDAYGVGVLVVVVGLRPTRGNGKAVYRAKQDSQVR